MYRTEFEAHVEKMNSKAILPDAEEYEVVERVYTFHPAFSVSQGKDQIAWLYATLGYGVIKSMLPEAEEAVKREEELARLRRERDDLEARLDELKKALDEKEEEIFEMAHEGERIRSLWTFPAKFIK